MKVKFSRCNSNDLASLPIIDGQLVYLKDTEQHYLDVGETRNRISDIIFLDDEAAFESIENPLTDKIYYIKSSRDLEFYTGSKWESITAVDASDVTFSDEKLSSTNVADALKEIEASVETNATNISTANTNIASNASNISTLQSQVQNLISKDTEIESNIDEIEGNVSQLQSDVTALQAGSATTEDIDDIKAEITSIKSKDSTQDQEIAAIKEKDTAQDTAIGNLQSKDESLDQDITALQSKDESLESDIEDLQAKDESIDTEIAAIKKKNTDQDTDITNIKVKDEAQDTSISTINKTLGEIDKSLKDINKKNTDQDTDITNLQTKDTELTSAIETLQAKDTSLDGDISSIKAKDTEQDGRLDALEAEDIALDKDISDLQDKDDDIDTEIAAIKVEQGTQNTNISTLQSDMTTARGDISTLKTNVTDINTALGDLEDKDESIDEEIAALKQKDIDLTSSIGTEHTKNEAQDTRLTDLESDMTSVQSDITSIKGTNTAQQTAIEALQAKDTSLDEDIEALQTKDTELAGDIDGLDTRVTKNEADIATNAGNISTNTTDISGLKTRMTTAEGNISTNTSNITSLETNLNTIKGNLEADIKANKEAIESNDTDIAGLDTRLTTAEGTIVQHTTDIAAKQNKTDNTLETTAKTVVGSINELKGRVDALHNYDDSGVTEDIVDLAAKVDTKFDADKAKPLIKDVKYDSKTATFTFTPYDGTDIVVDLPLESTVKTGRYDATKEALILVLVSDDEIEIPVKALIDIYTGDETTTISINVDKDNKITGTIKTGSISESLLDESVKTKLNKTYDLTPYATINYVDTELAKKVDKVTGYGLISDTERQRLANVDNYDDSELAGKVSSLESDNTTNKLDITTIKSTLTNKVDKVTGKGLSTNDFTDALKTKLDNIDVEANKYELPKASATTLGGIKVGTNLSIDSEGKLSATDTTYKNMEGATSTADGKAGLVPQPTKGNEGKYLKADGTWSTPTDTTYSKATTESDGLMSKEDKTKLNGLSNYDDTSIKNRLTTAEGNISTNAASIETINGTLDTKVDKVTGKGLSTNDFTNTLKTKLEGLSNYDDTAITGRVDTIASDLDTLEETVEGHTTLINNKVDKVTGKGLSTNDYTTAEKQKLAGLSNYDDTGVKSDISGLKTDLATTNEQVTANKNTLDTKVDKVNGKGLSTNDFTTAEKTKLAGLSNYDDSSIKTQLETAQGDITDIKEDIEQINTDLDKKVDKVSGKGLSTNDYTTTEKNKLAALSNYDDTSVKNRLTSLESDNTTNKTNIQTNTTNIATNAEAITGLQGDVSTINTSLGNKVDKVSGKGLSTNDYTTTEKNKLANIESNANNYTLPKASSTELGGIKVGNNLSIDSNGVLSATDTNTTYSDMKGATSTADGKNGLVPQPKVGDQGKFLRGDGSWETVNTDVYEEATTSKAGLMSASDKTKLNNIETGANKYSLPAATATTLGGIKIGTNLSIDADGVVSATDTNTTYSAMTGASSSADGKEGLVPKPSKGDQTKFLRADGTWVVPTNTTYDIATTAKDGLMSKSDKSKLDGLSNYDDTALSNKVDGIDTRLTTAEGTISSHTTAIDGKVDKVTGKGLSTNDYTTTEKTKLSGIATGATKVESSTTNGNIKINGTETKVYTKEALTKAEVTTALGYTPPTQDTTYEVMTGATADVAGTKGLVPQPAKGKQTSFLRGDGTWVIPTDTTYSAATQSASGLMSAADKKKLDGIADGATKTTDTNTTYSLSKSGSTITLTGSDGSTTTVTDSNTTYGAMTGASSSADGAQGLVPKPSKGDQNKFLTGAGTWAAASSSDTTYTLTQDATDGHKITLTPSSGTATTITIPDNDTTYTGANGVTVSGTTISNSGVRSVASGDNNGTIKVNTNGTSTNVSVKGLAGAAYKAVDTSISAASTSANVPTSAAVASFVEGKGYKTTDNNTTYTLTQDADDGHKITLTPSSGDATTITIPDNNTTYTFGNGLSASGTTVSNSGVRSVAEGTANGTISVNTNGTAADVKVKGLGSIAYKSSLTKSDVGLGNVDNTADANKSVKSAGTLTTARNIALSGAVTGNADFNGSKAITISTTLAGFDASKITSGTIDIARLPAAALPTVKVVADDTARFKLTTSDVQNGDSVKVTSTGKMYMVKDQTKLTSADGYEEYVVGNAAVAESCTGNAATATTLQNSRNFSITGGATAAAVAFDGSSNVALNVTSLDASKLTGTASISTTGNAATATSATSATNATNATNTGITNTNPTSATTYYGTFVDATSGNKPQRVNDGLRYQSLQGTTSAAGTSILILGNTTKSGTAGNKEGRVRIYNTSSGYTDIVGTASESNVTLTLPASTGTLVTADGSQALTNKTYNGYTLAAASAKGVVTSVDTSANLPTSNAVKTFVEGKGYKTTDTNYYPTTWAWTAGTTAGPTAKITGSGMSDISVAAVPAANGTTASGIVTTGAQTFGGVKTFSSAPKLSTNTITTNGGKTITFSDVDQTVATTSTSQALTNKTYNGLTLTAAATGFTIKGGTTAKTLTVNSDITLAAAAAKGVDTSIAAASTSTNLPTSAAVAAFVEGKGYKTTDTDTKVTVSNTNPTTGTWYYPTSYTSTSGTGGVMANDGLRHYSLQGTASAAGRTILQLGNATATGTAGNKFGEIRIYAEKAGFATLKATAAATAETVHTLPNTAGTILNTGTTSVSNAATSGTKVADLKINGTTTTLYAPTNTNTTYTLTQDASDGHKITLTPSSGTATTITIPDNNTTYSSKAAASGGTDVSLVTTGEKYTWNNKSSLSIGTTATTAAAGNHTHTLSIATDTGTNALTLAASTKYKLTAGGSTFIFTTPPNTNTWTAFKGATASAAGTAGYVPAPAAGDQAKFFKADGTWAVPTNTTYTFTNGLSNSSGTVSNSGVRSIATGGSNGTISVNTNGTSANVAVKGLAAAAYKGVDTSMTKTSTSTNVPTTAAVASLVSSLSGCTTTATSLTCTLPDNL